MKALKFIPIIIAFELFSLFVTLIGFFVTPILSLYRDVHYADLPWWTKPWANPEDWKGQNLNNVGSLPGWWPPLHGSGFWSFFRYHAYRNPASGLRSIPLFSMDLITDRDKIQYDTPYYLDYYNPKYVREAGLKSARFWCWVGWKGCFRYVRIWSPTRSMNIRIGWKVEPAFKVKGWYRKPAILAEYTGSTIDVLGWYRKA